MCVPEKALFWVDECRKVAFAVQLSLVEVLHAAIVEHDRRLVIAAAEYFGRQTRHAENLTWRDGLTVGLAQCLALVPGVSRSGATISAGLFLGLDRELAARFGFLLAIPAVFASGLFSLPDAFAPVSEGMSATGLQLLVSVVIAFVVGFAAIAWFLKFLITHSMYWFVGYRIVAGLTVLALLATGVLAAT
mgnify:CR=1 FL=1